MNTAHIPARIASAFAGVPLKIRIKVAIQEGGTK